MSMNRRGFILKSGVLAGSAVMLGNPLLAGISRHDIIKLTILHTNDVHSRVEPFPNDGSRNSGRGGAARRASLIRSIRSKEDNVLLFDSGDIIQGTPYFNFFGGEVEIKLMNAMQYNAATIGNHDFDGGMDGLKKMIDDSSFPFLVSNYDFSDTLLNNSVQPYKVFQVEGVKIGVFGLGIKMAGLVPTKLYGDTRYLDPIKKANATADLLRNEMGCDYIVCLSHLGYKYREGDLISDVVLAKENKEIDLILGGHTHSFLRKPDVYENKSGKTTLVNQAGFGGLLLGRIDILFERNKKNKCLSCKNIAV